MGTKSEPEESPGTDLKQVASDSLKESDYSLQFQNVTLFYDRTTKPAIKKISFTAYPGEKIGIVGRTGAGKSSILYCLFRLKDIEETGKIYFFGQDTKEMSLRSLRSRISYIPQDPFLFEGTIHENLDPLENHSREQVQAAFDTAGLGKGSGNLSLEFVLSEQGKNIAAGQKQLLCLARALLQKNDILVVDEATANVDQRTDAELQKTLRSEAFKETTILTIAHRIETIKDSNKIMVMDKGRLVDQGSYEELMKSSKIFQKMVEAWLKNQLEICSQRK